MPDSPESGAGVAGGGQELHAQIEALARAPLLLVAADFDGTLAPIVSDPEAAVADQEAIAALRRIAELPQTHAAIVSGRALSDLARRAPLGPTVHLIGSHGEEIAPGGAIPLGEEQVRHLDRACASAERAAASLPGARVERKPAGVAFHHRNADAAEAARAVEALRAELASIPGLIVRNGKKVVEFCVTDADKGKALAHLRRRVCASHVLFLGDDVTDEDAFAALQERDSGVKVGPGETVARHRISDRSEVASILAAVADLRRAHLDRSRAVPIERHAVLSDHRTLALLTPSGRVSFACMPRIDSPALFSELLGGPASGFFEIRPADASAPPAQRYVGDTMTVMTEWPDLRVTDYLEAGGGRAFQRAGRTDLVRVAEGTGRVRIEFAPRVDFGRSPTRLSVADGGLVVEGVREACVLRAPGVAFRIEESGRHDSAVAELDLDGRLVLELRYGTNNLAAAPFDEAQRRARTEAHWSAWARSLSLPRTARDLVLRSALTLRALTHGPTGAIAAAATTSLPEQMGGARNWDYRFCWPRDAAIAAIALAGLGAPGPGLKLLDWMLGILDRAEADSVVAPVYTVTGGHLATEGELSELEGYRDSRPVRVGNAAAQQLQIDVYGPIVDLLATLARRGAPLTYEHWRMTEAIVAAVAAHWQDPDHGIWEIRGPLRQNVHSKVMCWVALDRACTVAEYLGRRCDEWRKLRAAVAGELIAKGPRPSDSSFGAAYGGAESDASALWVGLSGFLAPDDPRFLATVARVERDLLHPPTVYRYRYDDGLPGVEGGFHLCTTWLIRAWILLGRLKDARGLFEQYAALAGPLGLFAEEHDPVHGVGLGNFPQGYSHAGLIEAALALDAAGAESGA